MSATISYEVYSTEKLESLRNLLINQVKNDNPRDFEIIVDDRLVVSRTSDPERFNDYLSVMHSDSRQVAVTLFHGKSNSYERIHFKIDPGGAKDPKPQELNGVEDVQKKIDAALAKERERIRYENLEKENDDLKEENRELKRKNTDLAEAMLEIKENGFLGNLNVPKVLSLTLEDMVRRNPQWLAKVPGGQALAGIIAEDNKEQVRQQDSEGTEVRMKKKAAHDDDELTEEQKEGKYFRAALRRHFSEEECEKICAMIECFENNRQDLHEAFSLIVPRPQDPKGK